MSEINLKLLQTFVLVAEQHSFRQAAIQVNRTPSAISMQIRDLENQIGMRLFNRTPQRVTLTADGRALYQETAQGMQQINNGLVRLSERVEKRKGKVAMGCAPTLALWRLGEILGGFRRRFPESAIKLLEIPPAQALALVAQQQIEFYVGPEVPMDNDCDFEPLFDDPFFACVPPEFDRGEERLHLADLGQIPVLMLDKTSVIRSVVDGILERQGLTLNIGCELHSAYTSLSLAASGLGVSILPGIALHMADFGGFRAVPIADEGAKRHIGLTTARGYIQHNYTEQLMKLIRTELKPPDPVPGKVPFQLA